MTRTVAFDLGSSCTRVIADGAVVATEPSLLAAEIFRGGIFTEESEYIACGNEARSLYRNTPGTVATVRPFFDDTTEDYAILYEYIDQLLYHYEKPLKLRGATVLLTLPAGISPAALSAVKTAFESAGVRKLGLVSPIAAAAVGASLPFPHTEREPKEGRGRLLIDLGAGATKLAIVSENGIGYTATLYEGGSFLDLSLADALSKKYRIIPDIALAEQIKCAVGSMVPSEGEQALPFLCRKSVSGLPCKLEIHPNVLRPTLLEHGEGLVQAIRTALTKIAPALLSEIAENGILLTGGGAALAGLPLFLQDFTGLFATVADQPELAVAKGLGTIATDPGYACHISFDR